LFGPPDIAVPGRGYGEKAAGWRGKLEELRATEPRSDGATEENSETPKNENVEKPK